MYSAASMDAPAGRAYYSICPHPGWRVCVLDPYEVSVLSQGGGRPGIDLDASYLDAGALELCQANNPNDVTQEDFARGLPRGPARRWVPFNGALGEAQLGWLRETLRHAYEAGEHTVLLSHVVLHPEATPGGNGLTLLWNYEELQAVLREAPRPPVAAFCGHAHIGEHAVDAATGTHHVTFASPLEVAPGSDACAVVDAYADGALRVRGRGVVPDATLQLQGKR
uniref:Calcineurin-like phosphoesterase domain-containing protein n=1 Tax=Alexandrium monilatum TaxID=311494 RepID=A0A7S4Q502_9DINO